MKHYLLSFVLTLFLSAACYGTGNWKLQYATGYRQVNGAQMVNGNAFVLVGGREANDSIRSINISYDGGDNIINVMDDPYIPWLKAVSFANLNVGYAVGYKGGVLKTTDGGYSWNAIALTGNFATRDYNAVFFTDALTGYIAGGNRANDSIQTILKTTDGGNSWAPQRDVFGHWLKDIFFIDANTGFAVGERGTVLKTINGGAQWGVVTLTGNAAQRTYNSVSFADANTGIIVGGNQANDSVQTILRSTDGGNTWGIIRDSVAPWLNDVHFYDAGNGYIVGDDGTLLNTTNKGLTWNSVIDTVNDKGHLNTVHFYSQYFGVAAGQDGKILIYATDSLPVVSLKTAGVIYVNPQKIILNGVVNNNGGTGGSNIWFEYDTSLSFNDTAVVVPANVSGAQDVPVSATLNNLKPGTKYYYRIKATNAYGVYFSIVDSFRSTVKVDEIENWGFEEWDTIIVERPVSWFGLGNVQKAPSFDAGHAVQLTTYSRNGMYKSSAVIYGLPDGGALIGGAPFAARPDSIKAYFKYDIAAGDSAAILVVFKLNGVVVDENTFFITGNSGGNFVPLSFALQYQQSAMPDTIVVGFTNSNPFSQAPAFLNSVLTVDKVLFAGTTVNVPDPDFENWGAYMVENPLSWFGDNERALTGGGFVQPFRKTTDSYEGKYALEIQNDRRFKTRGNSITLLSFPGDWKPAFPLSRKPYSFNGVYKFFPGDRDTLLVELALFYQGTLVFSTQFIATDSAVAYTPFSLSVFMGGFLGTPDSGAIRISSGGYYNEEVFGNARIVIDALTFDGLIDPDYVDTIAVVINAVPNDISTGALIMYPNPSNSILNIRATGFSDNRVEFEIVDLSGRLMNKFTAANTNGAATIDVSGYNAGVYVLTVRDANHSVSRKFVCIE